MTDDPPLTARQQQLMAYIDDELSAGERAEFERLMSNDPDLAMEAAQYRTMMDISHSMTLAEPTDQEIRRFWTRFYNRSEWRLGWILLGVGTIALVAEGFYLLLTSGALSLTQKGAVISSVLGAALLLLNTIRLKLKTNRLDRYRGVMR